jgi:hypothetical protein
MYSDYNYIFVMEFIEIFGIAGSHVEEILEYGNLIVMR